MRHDARPRSPRWGSGVTGHVRPEYRAGAAYPKRPEPADERRAPTVRSGGRGRPVRHRAGDRRVRRHVGHELVEVDAAAGAVRALPEHHERDHRRRPGTS